MSGPDEAVLNAAAHGKADDLQMTPALIRMP